jgi:hypothetical protein
MPEKSEKKSLSIPVSNIPPVTLYRPLKLFGATFKVHISTGLTLSPDTVLRSALDLSMLQLLRNFQPPLGEQFKDRPEKVIKDLLRAATGTNKLSTTTQNGVKRFLGRYVSMDILTAALQGIEPPNPIPWQSDWESALKGLGEPGDDDVYRLVDKMARLDRTAWSASQLPETDAVALLEKHIGRPHEIWRKYNPNLSLAVAFLIDTSLQTLIWMECNGDIKNRANHFKAPESRVLSLLAPGKKPLGHWLLRLQTASSCANLTELSSLLLRNGVKRHSFDVSHDLLKKWSSGQQLMPRIAAENVLKALAGRVEFERERSLFAVSRFLSFLCDLVIAGTRDAQPTWKVAQEQIRERYAELFADAVAARVPKEVV